MSENISLAGKSEVLRYFDSNINGSTNEAIDLRHEFEDHDVIWFGKYKGKKLFDISDGYLKYLWKEGFSKKTNLNNAEGKLARYIDKAINS